MRSNCSRSNRVAAVAVLALFSGCGYPPEKTVLLEITGVEDDRMSEAVQTILLSLVDEGTGHSISASGMDPTFVRLAPVSDVERFRKRISFGAITAVEGRTIELTIDREKVFRAYAEIHAAEALEAFRALFAEVQAVIDAADAGQTYRVLLNRASVAFHAADDAPTLRAFLDRVGAALSAADVAQTWRALRNRMRIAAFEAVDVDQLHRISSIRERATMRSPDSKYFRSLFDRKRATFVAERDERVPVVKFRENEAAEAVDPPEKPGTVVTNSIGMKLARIPAGDFQMGSEDSFDDEMPRHRVWISMRFHLGVHEVTQGEWTEVMGSTPWKDEDQFDQVKEGDRYPASYVSWEDATEFCRRLADRERAAGLLLAGESYRLPTEAEWEYACRAGSGTRYHFGDWEGSLGEYAWFDENTMNIDETYAHEVGRKRANAWGLFDMHGNLSEWCSDRYGARYYRVAPGTDPLGPSEGAERVSRGGAWYDDASDCWSAGRRSFPPKLRENLGFRVVRGFAPSR